MRKYLLLLTFMLFCLQIKVYACTCTRTIWSAKLINWHFSTSELIFIGEPIFDKTPPKAAETYSLKVVEIIKGSVKVDTLIGKFWSSCSTSPNSKGKWIIYSEHVNYDSVSFSACSLSRNITTLIDYQPHGKINVDSIDLLTTKQKWKEEYLMLKELVEAEEDERMATKILTYSAVGLVFLIGLYLVFNHRYKKHTSLR